MIDDVHHLQDRARTLLPVPLTRCDVQKLFERRSLDGLRDGEGEIAPEIGDRLALDALRVRAVRRIIRVEFVVSDEATHLLGVVEIQPVPIDDRAPSENQPDGLEIVKIELVGRLQSMRYGTRRRRSIARRRPLIFQVLIAI